MNIKVTVKNAFDKIVYCVISPDEDREKQFAEVLGCRPGQGFSARVYDDRVVLVDYFSGENRATFPILSEEACDLPVTLRWVSAE